MNFKMAKSKKIDNPSTESIIIGENIVGSPTNHDTKIGDNPTTQNVIPQKIEEPKPEVSKPIVPKLEKIEEPKPETSKPIEPKPEKIEEPKSEVSKPIEKPKRKISEKSLANLRNSKIKSQKIEEPKPEVSKPLEKINTSLPGESTKPSKLLFYVGIALAIFVTCIGGLFIYNWYKSKKSTKQNLVQSASIEDLDQDTIANLKKIAEANRNFEEST